mmetsp:Transcript_27225/g.75108  ORF Transcript_27225/g.75108 Transcript_27225/m.75108 type:complete len:86 (+) Transcript_27225:1755-2012(+)
MAARRKHQLDTQESIRTVMIGAAIQNKTNIVGASMASFLTRNPSRFLISHESNYFPVDELVKDLTEGVIKEVYVMSYCLKCEVKM